MSSTPKQGLENLVEQLEFRLRDMELRLEETESRMREENEKHRKEKKELAEQVETRMKELEGQMKKEKDEAERGSEASTSKLRMEVESLRKEVASNFSNSALTNPSLRDLPIVLISTWQPSILQSPQTVTFNSFLANYNNVARPGGGDGVLDLDSGVFTCFTPGYYTVSFSAMGAVGPDHPYQDLYLYKNDMKFPESYWHSWRDSGDSRFGFTGSRIVVSKPLINVCTKYGKFEIVISPDSAHGCRRHPGAKNDERRLHQTNHTQH